jgi:hypothetical protein
MIKNIGRHDGYSTPPHHYIMVFKKDFVTQNPEGHLPRFFWVIMWKKIVTKKKDSKGLSTHLQMQLQVT